MDLDPSTRSLCIEAGFSETSIVSAARPDELHGENSPNLPEETFEQNLHNNLIDKITLLERNVGVLKHENNELRQICASQQEEQSFIKAQLFELSNIVTNLKKMFDEVTVDQNHNIASEKNEKVPKSDPITVLNVQMDTLTADVNKINAKFESFTSHITSLSKTLYRLDSDVQKFVKKHSLIIENLCPKEDISAMEMLLVFVNSVLNVPITDSDIENLHIIDKCALDKPPTSTPEKNKIIRPRPLLVTFTCYKTQSHIYKSWLSLRSKCLTGSLSHERGQGITIKEYLTEQQEEVYNQALKLKEEHLVADCWTYKGKSYIKKLNGDVSEFCNRNEIVPKTETSNCLVM